MRRPGLVVALDVPTAEEAVGLAELVAPHVAGVKVGLGLLHGPGPAVVAALCRMGLDVFADAKLHDIPSQVAAASRRLGEHGARWVSAHAGGGRAMLEAAVSGLRRGAGGAPAGIFAVTVLTSLERSDLRSIGVGVPPERLVVRMARLAAAAGCEGVVSSPRELSLVGEHAPGLLRVTPGIRPRPADDDQARVATPTAAIGWGADLLVVGRPVTTAADPAAAAAEIAAEITGAATRRR